jgi:catecholate siderophore receptor
MTADLPPAALPVPAAGSRETIVVKAAAPPKSYGLSKLPGTLQTTPQSIDIITATAMKHQAATSIEDALRFAPGITLNSGEGGAHGDNINLRGFHALDSFFLDGMRDPGADTRDNFDAENIEVLQGPASVLFGNGPAGGVVNQTSKAATLATRQEASVETGTNDEARATLDIDQPIGDTAAFRLNVMGDRAGVAGRDYVEQRRWGIAPSFAWGLKTDMVFKVNFLHQQEDNIPDYGIPFLWGKPAPVNTSNYYGLKNYDRTQTNTDILTASVEHSFADNFSVTNSFRYASYWANYRVSSPHFGDDDPNSISYYPPGTALADIVVYRDRPSSLETQTYLTDNTDITAHLTTGPFAHTLITGVELGHQTNDFLRYNDTNQGIDGILPTTLLAPNANEAAPVQNMVVARPDTATNLLGLYLTDRIALLPTLSADLGVRFDRYDTGFSDIISATAFHRVDSAVTPKFALVYKPAEAQVYYVSYTTSFDPAVSYLTLAGADQAPVPMTARTFEAGVKLKWMDGLLSTNAAVFRTTANNVSISDPNDPSLQQQGGVDERVEGMELSVNGYLTSTLEINANYTLLDPVISASSTPGETGRIMPAAARNTANLWLEYRPVDKWQFAGGVNFIDMRYADSANTARIPGYAILSTMIGYQLTDRTHLQFNISNLTDARYFTGAYYGDATENHVIPGEGRVFTFGATMRF